MLTVPPDLALRYDAARAERAAIEPAHLAHYRKWLRYYLDFFMLPATDRAWTSQAFVCERLDLTRSCPTTIGGE